MGVFHGIVYAKVSEIFFLTHSLQIGLPDMMKFEITIVLRY